MTSSQTYGDSVMLLDWAAGSGIVQVGVNDAGVLECEFCTQLAGGVGCSRLWVVGWRYFFASWELGNIYVLFLVPGHL